MSYAGEAGTRAVSISATQHTDVRAGIAVATSLW